MTKAEEKRAAIVAQQEARELAERESRQASGGGAVSRRGSSAKPRTNWAASSPLAGPRRGRPSKPHE